jgi:uncharacterized protein YlzI (FlbEa/FlbD family)
MIRLTHESGKSIYINPDKIVDIFSTETGHAQLLFVIGEGYRVTESPQEVARKVLEYRLSMIDYQVDIEGAGAWARKQLEKLAGLEETCCDCEIEVSEQSAREQLNILKAALEYYADDRIWVGMSHTDSGRRARSALLSGFGRVGDKDGKEDTSL